MGETPSARFSNVMKLMKKHTHADQIESVQEVPWQRGDGGVGLVHQGVQKVVRIYTYLNSSGACRALLFFHTHARGIHDLILACKIWTCLQARSSPIRSRGFESRLHRSGFLSVAICQSLLAQRSSGHSAKSSEGPLWWGRQVRPSPIGGSLMLFQTLQVTC